MSEELIIGESKPTDVPADPTVAEMPRPLFDYVLLQSEKEVKAKSGLYLPADANYAIVVAVGPGNYQYGTFVPTTVKPGDRVALNMPPDVPKPILRWGDKYVCVQECFLCAVLPGDAPPEAPRIEIPKVSLS